MITASMAVSVTVTDGQPTETRQLAITVDGNDGHRVYITAEEARTLAATLLALVDYQAPYQKRTATLVPQNGHRRRTPLPTEKRCQICGETKPITMFSIRRSGNPMSYCRPCNNARVNAYHVKRALLAEAAASVPQDGQTQEVTA